jgi:hypothetical protein
MPTENDKRRVRRAVEQTSPAPSPEVRKRALWAVMVAMRRGAPLRPAAVLILVLLVAAATVYALVRWLAWD